jgi:hypothetical protein
MQAVSVGLAWTADFVGSQVNRIADTRSSMKIQRGQ